MTSVMSVNGISLDGDVVDEIVAAQGNTVEFELRVVGPQRVGTARAFLNVKPRTICLQLKLSGEPILYTSLPLDDRTITEEKD
jgi:hypothetical protein